MIEISASSLSLQLQELRLIQCSLLPDEHFTFILAPDDAAIWTSLLDAYAIAEGTPADNTDELSTPPTQALFQVKLESARIWFQIELPRAYPDNCMPLVSIKGDDITREEQERWQGIVRRKMTDLEGTEFPIYELVSAHLLPMLHADNATRDVTGVQASKTPEVTVVAAHYHALLTSHHLKSPTKRRSLQQWSSELSLSGFAKVGYPGVIYVEGAQENVEDFVLNVKAMQWLALRVRFIEPVMPTPRTDASGNSNQHWVELEKIGEVVEEMRKRGKEYYVVEMGIGSAGTSK